MQKERSTILIVDDIEKDINILLDVLNDKYDTLVALDGRTALEIVEYNSVDLILIDIMMPTISGFDICETLKLQSSTKDIPVVFITAQADEESIAKSFSVGGADFIAKPFKPLELIARVKTQIELRTLVNHLEFIASYDSMTGVYNRRKFFSLAQESFDTIKINLYAIMIDIDKFKSINDKYGHAFGDKVITFVAQTIKKHILEGAIFARIGGEEFAILCHSSSEDEIIDNMQEIRLSIEKLELFTENGERVVFTISEGMAKSDKSMNSIDDLLKKADDALYEAKGAGRNTAIFR